MIIMGKELVCFVFALFWSYVLSDTCVTPLGANSNCVSLYSCPELMRAFDQRPLSSDVIDFLRQSQCGFEGYTPRVCCGPLPSQQDRPQTTPPPRSSRQPTQIQGDVDPVYNEDSSPAPSNECGLDNGGDKIYGGQLTDLGEFPWLVLEGYRTSKGSITYQCGGVLVNRRYVLTAAHCITGAIETQVGTLYSVRLGEYDTQKEVDCVQNVCADPPQEILVQSAYPHPGYSDRNKNKKDDIGLIRLAKRAVYNDYIQPICLAKNNQRIVVGNDVYVAGWGKTLEGRNSPIKLKLVMPIYNKDECNRKYRRLGADLIDKQICAGGVFAEDACKGDSGGPLMMMRSDGAWESVAIVSFGRGCGNDGWPGVYTSVASYLDWILTTMRSTNV